MCQGGASQPGGLESGTLSLWQAGKTDVAQAPGLGALTGETPCRFRAKQVPNSAQSDRQPGSRLSTEDWVPRDQASEATAQLLRAWARTPPR